MNKTVLILFDPDLAGYTKIVRGLRYRDMFAPAGWNVIFCEFRVDPESQILTKASSADVIYLLKIPSLDFIAQLRKSSRAKIVFDLTDALWTPPHNFFFFKLDEILAGVDAIFTVNEFDTSYASRFNRVVIPIPPSSIVEQFDDVRPTLPPPDPHKLVIGWVGGQGTIQALKRPSAALTRLCAEFPDLHVRILGCALPSWLSQIRATALEHYDEADMVREILKMDIGLYPAPSDLHDFQVRGPQKALLYMAGKVVPVTHNAGQCAQIIQNGVNGMLVGSDDEWYDALRFLLVNPTQRSLIAQAGYTTVKDRFSMNAIFQTLIRALEIVVEGPSGKTIDSFPPLTLLEKFKDWRHLRRRIKPKHAK